MRRCTVCQRDKPAHDFYKHNGVKCGLFGKCRACLLEYQRQRRKVQLESRGLTVRPYGPQARTAARDILCRPVIDA